ncbi:MAG: hypothetical protein V7767_07920 [Leeuwenhoekiella sp.]
MVAEFTQNEKNLLKGHGQSIARKHKCSQKYVRYIILGQREINTELAKKVYTDCKTLAEFLTPKEAQK